MCIIYLIHCLVIPVHEYFELKNIRCVENIYNNRER